MSTRYQFFATVAALALQLPFGVQSARSGEPNSDTFIHRGSQVSLPRNVGGCDRGDIEYFDESGDDVGAQYTCPRDSGLVINLFVYPSTRDTETGKPILFTEECDAARATVLEKHAESHQIKWPNQFITANNEGVQACHLAFALPRLKTRGGTISALSLLQIYNYGPWLLKFRISYAEHDGAAAELIRGFHLSFPWKKAN